MNNDQLLNEMTLEEAMKEYVLEVQQIEASAIWITVFGIALLIVIKIIQGVLANSKLEKRYQDASLPNYEIINLNNSKLESQSWISKEIIEKELKWLK